MSDLSQQWLSERLSPRVRVVTSTREAVGCTGQFGFNLATHVYDDPLAVEANRNLLMHQIGVTIPPVWLDQTHSDRVVAVDLNSNQVHSADGSYTEDASLPLAILTADCLPIVLWSENEIAVVHAGWRGLANGIIGNALAKFGGSVSAWIGAGIGPCHYEVDDAVAAHFESNSAFDPSRPGHYWFDLPKEAKSQLVSHGVQEVAESGICTGCDGRFYSHRVEGPTGRFATVAWLES